MATKTTEVHFRVDLELKHFTETIAKDMGMNLAQILRLFMAQVKAYKGLPFNLRRYKKATLNAMQEAKNWKKLKAYDTFETFLKEENL